MPARSSLAAGAALHGCTLYQHSRSHSRHVGTLGHWEQQAGLPLFSAGGAPQFLAGSCLRLSLKRRSAFTDWPLSSSACSKATLSWLAAQEAMDGKQ